MYYPIAGSREAHIRLDKLGKHKYPWYNADQLRSMHYHLNTGKTVTWYIPDPLGGGQAIARVYPISHEVDGSEPVVTYADTTIYQGEVREIQIKQWQGLVDPGVCQFFEPDDEVTYHGHLSPINDGSVRPMPGILFGEPSRRRM